MNEKVSNIVSAVKELTIAETISLVDSLCEVLGISKDQLCAAPVAGGQSSGGGESAEAAKTEFNLVLKGAGEKKIEVIKVVKEILACGLKEAKELVESCPKAIKEKVSKAECEELKKKLDAAGAVSDIE